METETDKVIESEDTSATDSGDEPPLKSSKTKDDAHGQPTANSRKKKKKRKKQETQQRNDNPPTTTHPKRPSIKVAGGKSRHPF
jgi:hypothetical protein